jgi:hypothetical protein
MDVESLFSGDFSTKLWYIIHKNPSAVHNFVDGRRSRDGLVDRGFDTFYAASEEMPVICPDEGARRASGVGRGRDTTHPSDLEFP